MNNLNNDISRVRQRHIPDIDHRKPHQILRVRLRRYQAVIVRNEFGVDTRFLTYGHNIFQMMVLLPGEKR